MATIQRLLAALVLVAATQLVAQDERINRLEKQLKVLQDQLADIKKSSTAKADSKFLVGGYGEIHATFGEGDLADVFDFHRIVFYVGYDFADWVTLNSEFEIEHAYVTDGAGGELVIEQFYLDFMLSDIANIRVGRILTPLGVINQHHEPTSFNGVERPSFYKYIVPSTWSSDGIGLYGDIAPNTVSYEFYVVGGLDGSQFEDKDGIRGGRIEERTGLSDLAATGRVDWHISALRLGTSFYAGSIDNANKDANNGIDGDIRILSVDAETSVGDFDFRGAYAHTKIHGAKDIGNGTAEEIMGWYSEIAYHIMPDAWKTGKLEEGDLVVFARYDEYDTQYKMPDGTPADDAYDRYDWTFGLTFHVTNNLVVKADHQKRRNHAGGEENYVNVGLGWDF